MDFSGPCGLTGLYGQNPAEFSTFILKPLPHKVCFFFSSIFLSCHVPSANGSNKLVKCSSPGVCTCDICHRWAELGPLIINSCQALCGFIERRDALEAGCRAYNFG